MHEPEGLRRWAALARHDRAPSIDVTDAVLRRIQARASPALPRSDAWPMASVAAASALAASVVGALALQAWLELTDPAAGLWQSITLLLD